MITAQEARELSGPTAEDYLVEIDKCIQNAANKQERSVIMRSEPYARWLYNESKLSAEPKLAIKKLRDAGFTVSLYYAEYQFVDMGLQIQW